MLATLDESTYSGGADGFDHPIAWYHDYDGGRAWYTGLGHTDASYSEPLFREHLLGGIQYAAGQIPSDGGATVDANFQKVVLEPDVAEPDGAGGRARWPRVFRRARRRREDLQSRRGLHERWRAS